MALAVVRPGAFTTVQDHGRIGWRDRGVPVGGAFDRLSLDLANALLGNPPEAASLELTLMGGEFYAEAPLSLSLAGAEMPARVVSPGGDVRDLSYPQSFRLHPGEWLQIGAARSGARTYLAVRGGWQVDTILGSRSSEIRIDAGCRLHASSELVAEVRLEHGHRPDPSAGPIRIVDGPDGDRSARLLDGFDYRVSAASDRMGLRLDGHPIPLETNPVRLSAPVAPGAIQVAGGRPILLGVAGGTMGGYPHVAHVISADLDRIGQARPGDTLHFQRIPLDDARLLDRARRADIAAWLRIVRVACGGIQG